MGGIDACGLRSAALALAGMASAALQLQQPALWSAPAYAAMLGLAGLAAGLTCRVERLRDAALCCGLACALFATTGLRAGARLADALPAALSGQDILVAGVVAELPCQMPDGVRFTFEAESATQDGQSVQVPQRISLDCYRGWDGDALIAAPFAAVRAGQRWRFTVRLKAQHGTLIPQGCDFELWLFEQGIRASGEVRATDRSVAQRLDESAAFPVERLRQHVRDALLLRVAEPRAAGVLAALAVGDQAAIDGAVQKSPSRGPQRKSLI